MKLIAAVFTFEAFTTTDAVVAWLNNATFGAGRYNAVGLLEHVVEASVISREAFVKLFDSESHYLLVYYRGYMLSRDSLDDQYIRRIGGDACAAVVKKADIFDNLDMIGDEGEITSKRQIDRIEKYGRALMYLSRFSHPRL